MFYSDTPFFFALLMLNLSTFLHCKCNFLPKMFGILNKTTIFAVCYYNTRNKMFNLIFATMKAIIVKDNNFKTVGFEVTEKEERVFVWGISPNPMAFTKEVSLANYLLDIFKLVKLNAKLEEQKNFVSNFFNHSIDKKNVRCSDNKHEIDETKDEIERIIQGIK